MAEGWRRFGWISARRASERIVDWIDEIDSLMADYWTKRIVVVSAS